MFVRYLNLPPIPDQIISNLNQSFDQYQAKAEYFDGIYMWSDSFNKEINKWCQQNICDSMYFAFQIINGHLPIHKDINTLVKLNYIISTGGDEVVTNFWGDDQATLLASYKIQPHRWHILKADTYHNVDNVQPNRIRFSITGRVFGID